MNLETTNRITDFDKQYQSIHKFSWLLDRLNERQNTFKILNSLENNTRLIKIDNY